MEQPSLFDQPYPQSPGYKSRDTARAAAEAIKPRQPTLQQRILRQLSDSPMTPDECAGHIGASQLAVRPRFSELAALGKIADTGQRRTNGSFRKAIVWRLA